MVNTIQEFIYVESGEIEASIYRNNWSVVKAVRLKKGRMIEIKIFKPGE